MSVAAKEQDVELRSSEPDVFDAPDYFANREIHRRVKEARDVALTDVAAGMGLEIAYVRESAETGRARLDASRGDLDAVLANDKNKPPPRDCGEDGDENALRARREGYEDALEDVRRGMGRSDGVVRTYAKRGRREREAKKGDEG